MRLQLGWDLSGEKPGRHSLGCSRYRLEKEGVGYRLQEATLRKNKIKIYAALKTQLQNTVTSSISLNQSNFFTGSYHSLLTGEKTDALKRLGAFPRIGRTFLALPFCQRSS